MACYIDRILTIETPIRFSEVELYNESGVNIINNCFLSWSTDNVCWTNWTTYQNYLAIAKNIEGDFYLRILFKDIIKNLYINGMLTECYNVCIMPPDFGANLCNDNVLNPYANLDCALQLQQQLSDSIICMLGIPIYYFYTKPNVDTADYTFKEYVLHNVESVKYIKLMIQDGEMPSSKPIFSDWDFDFDNGWEVEMSKSEFARAFGDNEFPKSADFIYIPMMKRMWNVKGAYDEKKEGLMWRSTTWHLQLEKYNDRTNTDDGDYEEVIASLTDNNYMNLWGEKEEKEQERLTGTAQIASPKFAANNLYPIFMSDAVRKYITKDSINIIERQINNTSAIVTRNMYDMTSADSCVMYQRGYCGDEGVISFIIDVHNMGTISSKILTIGDRIEITTTPVESGIEMTFCGNTCELLENEVYLIICKWNRKTFTTEVSIYRHKADDRVPVYKLRPEMYRFEKVEDNYISAYNNDLVMNDEQSVVLYGYPHYITNLKVFNRYMSDEQALSESLKYSTNCKTCIINDLARPIDSGLGYDIR